MEHTNPSRTSHGNLIAFIELIACDLGWKVIAKGGQNKAINCFPYLVVSRDLPIERDGWQRSEEWSEEFNAIKYETDVYFTYRLKSYGKDSEMMLLDLQQRLLRSDAKAYLQTAVGGQLIRTENVIPRSQKYGNDFIDSAWLDVRLGFIDTTYEVELDCPVLESSNYINNATGLGQLAVSEDDTDPTPVPFSTFNGEN